MTDLERMRSFLRDTGVLFEESGHQTWSGHGDRTLIDVAPAPNGPKNTGYNDFVTTLVFDSAGQLLEWGTWE